MTIQEAKKLDLYNYLLESGFSPKKFQSTSILWYLSPFRKENVPSFKLDILKNEWFDFGLQTGGDIVNFVQIFHNVNTSEALKIISQQKSTIPRIYPHSSNKSKIQAIKIISITKIRNSYLKEYIVSRKIPLDLAQLYLHEIHYQVKERNFFALGFENDSGGYELRSRIFKNKTSNSISTIQGNEFENLNVFEGCFDLLSALTKFKQDKPKCTTIVLNSIGNIKNIQGLMSNYKKISLFLDNDDSGRKASQSIQGLHNNVIDNSCIYAGYKDFNDYLVQNTEGTHS